MFIKKTAEPLSSVSLLMDFILLLYYTTDAEGLYALEMVTVGSNKLYFRLIGYQTLSFCLNLKLVN